MLYVEKGFFWVATRPTFVGEMSQAGALVRHQGIGNWWVTVPEESWPEDPEIQKTIKKNWDQDFGDRRQELVFIGLSEEMDEKRINERLCLR